MRITLLGMEPARTAMARNLVEAGHEVTLYSPHRKPTAKLAETGARVEGCVADSVREAQVAVTIVADDSAEETLTFSPGGLLTHLPPGAIHLCLSSIGPAASLRLAAAHGGAGQGYVAAPMLGSLSAIPSRRVWFLAAGPAPQVNRCLAILEALGKGIHRIGTRPELAHALKLGASALTGAMAEALGEVLNYGEKAGLAPAEYVRILNLSLFNSPLLDAMGGLMVRHDDEPSIQKVDHAAHDLDLLVQSAQEQDLELPMAGLLAQRLQNARALELGGRDLTALALAHRRQAGPEPAAGPSPAAAVPAPLAAGPGRPIAAPGRPAAERRKAPSSRKAGEREKRRAAATMEPLAAAAAVAPPAPPAPAPVPPPAPAPPRPAPLPWPAPPDRPLMSGSSYLAQDAGTPLTLDLWHTSHFEFLDDGVWAWVEGQRHGTFWRNFAEVEQALGQIQFVRIQDRFLLNPQAVQELKPMLWGRAKVSLAGGLRFTASREATRQLRFMLG